MGIQAASFTAGYFLSFGRGITQWIIKILVVSGISALLLVSFLHPAIKIQLVDAFAAFLFLDSLGSVFGLILASGQRGTKPLR